MSSRLARFLAVLSVFIAAFAVPLSLAEETAKTATLDCTDPSLAVEYSAVLTKMHTCEVASGISLVLPLKKKKRVVLCEKCPELLALRLAKTVPLCNITISDGSEIRLQKALNKWFNQCDGTAAASMSDSGSSDSSDSSDSGSSSAAGSTATTKIKAPTSTPSPTATESQTTTQTSDSKGASISTGVIIGGIIAGVVVLALIAVIFVLMRRRGKNNEDKFDSAILESQSGRPTVPYQFSLITASSGTGSKSGGSSRPMQSPPVNLWEDPLIVAARVPKDKVVFTTLVSRGGFGEVYMGIYNRQTVAIKMLLPETRKDLEEINAFLAEVKLMATLEHERIVTFIGVAWDSLNDICVLTEYMEGGDLRGAIVHWEEIGRRRGFDNDKVKIALHIAHALTYMHSLRPVVLHRDLKSKNILLDNHLNAKLTDFGVSRERIDQTMTAGVGTSLWMAPEVMMGERYNEKADIFSFGVVLSELSTHDVPYGKVKESGSGHKIPDSAVLQMVSQGRLRVKFTPNSMAEVEELGISCVALNPRDRPTASDVLYTLHSILKNMFVVT
ncbi:Tkl protein kinase, partial [Globisporangium splendens]